MGIAFIRPGMTDTRSTDAMQPLVFAILSGLTPPDVETVLYDERLERWFGEEPLDDVSCSREELKTDRLELRMHHLAINRSYSHPVK